MSDSALTEPAKLLLLCSLLAKDRVITSNGKALLKELVVRKDPRMYQVLREFEAKESADRSFPDKINSLIADEAFRLYQRLFSSCTLENGKALSKSEREKKSLQDEKSLIYGEVEYNSFAEVLRRINPKPGGIFYDLGSGTGKAIFVARLNHDFEKCIGIEVLTGLWKASQEVCKKFREDIKEYLDGEQKLEVSCQLGSILEHDWSDGDVVFANSTCFDDALMRDMSKQAEKLKEGSVFISFTKPLVSERFEIVDKKRYEMSWGPATVFLHKRLPVGQVATDNVSSVYYTSTQDVDSGVDVSAGSASEADESPSSSPAASPSAKSKKANQSLRQQALSRRAVAPHSLPPPTGNSAPEELNSSPFGSALLEAKGRRRSNPQNLQLDVQQSSSPAVGAPSSPFGKALLDAKGKRRAPLSISTEHFREAAPQGVSSPIGSSLLRAKGRQGREGSDSNSLNAVPPNETVSSPFGSALLEAKRRNSRSVPKPENAGSRDAKLLSASSGSVPKPASSEGQNAVSKKSSSAEVVSSPLGKSLLQAKWKHRPAEPATQ